MYISTSLFFNTNNTQSNTITYALNRSLFCPRWLTNESQASESHTLNYYALPTTIGSCHTLPRERCTRSGPVAAQKPASRKSGKSGADSRFHHENLKVRKNTGPSVRVRSGG